MHKLVSSSAAISLLCAIAAACGGSDCEFVADCKAKEGLPLSQVQQGPDAFICHGLGGQDTFYSGSTTTIFVNWSHHGPDLVCVCKVTDGVLATCAANPVQGSGLDAPNRRDIR